MPQYPIILAGETVTAELLMSMLPLHAAKSVPTPRPSTTTVTADPELQLQVEANAEYLFEFYFRISGDPAADMDIKFTVPSGSTGS
ncbi:hypothetical protein ACWD4O_14035 [Streptomyces sp. NPDC002623]